MNIGLFFGSFNPIHIGHLIVANVMAESTDLDQVWFVVSPQNPFKKNKQLLHEEDRYKLVELAIQNNHKLKVNDVEFSMPRPSYTIDTLLKLREKHPQHTFRLIIGEDNLAQFSNWKSYEQILTEFGLYVYPRPNAAASVLKEHPNVRLVEAPLLDISATFIRAQLKAGRTIRYMVSEEVETYIRWKKYYV
ncbi:MAG: nicotinate (nicotinamide) nucleotide adenylyltransferase [Siphonobacter sp.]